MGLLTSYGNCGGWTAHRLVKSRLRRVHACSRVRCDITSEINLKEIQPPYNGPRVNGMLTALRFSTALAMVLLFLIPARDSHAHNVVNAILWNREISRIFYQRCATCHR